MSSDSNRTSLNVRVTEDFRDHVDSTWRSRGFANRSEFVRSALRDAVHSESDLTEEARTATEPSSREEAIPFDAVAEQVRSSDRSVRVSGAETSERREQPGRKPNHDEDVDAIIRSSLGYEEEKLDRDISITAIGCGGGGVRIVDKLHRLGIQGARTVTLDTDREELDDGESDTRALIGKSIFDGDGAEGDIDQVREAAERVAPALTKFIRDSDLVFVLTGLGGGTGTAVAPQVAEMASQTGAVVVSVATLPFLLEQERRKQAREGLSALEEVTDTLVVLDGHQIMESDSELAFGQALEQMNEDIAQAVTHIATYMGEFRVFDSDQSLLSMLEDGGYSALLESSEWVDDPPTSDISQLLSDRLLEYSTVNLDSDHIEKAILLFTAGENITPEMTDNVVEHVHDWTDYIAWHAQHGLIEANRLDVTGILTGIDVDIDDVISVEEHTGDQQPSSVVDIEILGENLSKQSPSEILFHEPESQISKRAKPISGD